MRSLGGAAPSDSPSRHAACRCVSVRATTCAINVARSGSAVLIVTVCPDLMPVEPAPNRTFLLWAYRQNCQNRLLCENGGTSL